MASVLRIRWAPPLNHAQRKPIAVYGDGIAQRCQSLSMTTHDGGISAAPRSGLHPDYQVRGSPPSHDQPRGLGLSCKCPHLQPEGEKSRLYTRLVARSAFPHRFWAGPCPAERSLRTGERSGKGCLRPEGGAQKNQSGPCGAINCAHATHVSSLLPATLLLPVIAHMVDRTSVEYPRCREKRATTMHVRVYRRPRHGPHADQMQGPLFLSMDCNQSPSQRCLQGLTHE
jgi:hypothetical protein